MNLLYTAVLVILGGAVLAVVVFLSMPQPSSSDPVQTNGDTREQVAVSDARSIELGGACVDIEFAITQQERTQGLSGRSELAPNAGMLFVYPTDGRHGIWMKDMNFSLDIIWFSGSHKVVHIQENASPESFPESFQPRDPARYVLEVPAGFVDEYGLAEGNVMQAYSSRCLLGQQDDE